MVADARTGRFSDIPAYWTYIPRRDQPERYDEQESFYYDKVPGVSWIIGGNGCVPAHYPIYNPIDGTERPIISITGKHWVLAVDPHTGKLSPALADAPYLKGRAKILRIKLSNGQTLWCTAEHRVLDSKGLWKKAGQLDIEWDSLYAPQLRCRVAHPLPSEVALRYTPDDYEFLATHPAFLPRAYCGIARVVSVAEEPEQDFYDFGVPGYGNYYAGGLVHANSGTTTTAIAKAIKFILETPAPRRDTPFWFIAETYEQVCNLYDEKLSNLGHLPEHLIEHNRIFWKNRNNNWPMRVPLISHQGRRGKNWVLEFKSWKQGRGQMQARSIGGFLFMEQFPWKVFEEVVRGCREYNFPGAKLVEYTPVDPDLSIEIEEMLENGYEPEDTSQRQKGARYMPKDWKVYHCNTACAMEQGHVDKAWFEEFFGMIPEDMLDVRMKGLFASFEGTIYKEFDVKTHCVGDEAWKHLQDAHWIRGIDWGGGPENAFAALLVGITGDGVAYVMDEYYSFNQECTTIDHLVNIQEQMPWPIENPNYGMTYADPADPDNFRIASKLSQYAKSHRGVDIQNMPMARAKNAVFEGIEHIRMMLKPSRVKMVFNKDTNMLEEKKIPRLYIHKGNCPNLIRELKTYRWQKSSDPSGKGIINPRAAKRAPAKFNDHACFTPDTLVQVGWKTVKPICEVEVGGTVEGRDKRSRVLAGWTVTRRDVEILELRFKDSDEVIRCTPDHRLWYWGQWVRAECLKDDTDIFSSWTSYVVPEVGCIATQSGNFKLACGIVAKNCDALRYALATHYQSMGMTIESARLSKPRTGAPESLRESGKRYSAVTEMHRVD